MPTDRSRAGALDTLIAQKIDTIDRFAAAIRVDRLSPNMVDCYAISIQSLVQHLRTDLAALLTGSRPQNQADEVNTLHVMAAEMKCAVTVAGGVTGTISAWFIEQWAEQLDDQAVALLAGSRGDQTVHKSGCPSLYCAHCGAPSKTHPPTWHHDTTPGPCTCGGDPPVTPEEPNP